MSAESQAKGLQVRGLDKTYLTLSGDEVEALIQLNITPAVVAGIGQFGGFRFVVFFVLEHG